MELQDSEADLEAELELSLSQLPFQPSSPTISFSLPFHPRDEGEPSHPLKKPCVD